MPGGKKVCVARQQKCLILQCCDVVCDVLRIGCLLSSSAPGNRAVPGGRQGLFADPSLGGGPQLPVLVGAQDGDPLKGISEGLRQQREAAQPIRTLHLIAHGRPGAFRIGDVWSDAEALKAHAADLAHWDLETIALLSCHVGADAITTSGLNYDSNGNRRFLLNNVGKR